jgi:monovalent cation:H+ antiporter-2, CPA2 family
MNPNLYLIVRTQFLSEVKVLRDLGADEVIPEEFETSVKIFSRVLKKYLMPKGTIEQFTHDIRADSYQVWRSPAEPSADLSDIKLNIPNVDISALKVFSDSSIVGESLSRINVRKEYAVIILAIRRKGEILANPSGDMNLEPEGEVL